MADQPKDATVQAIQNDIQIIADNAVAVVQIVAKVNWWTAICGFFTALPGILALIQSFMTWLNAVSGNNPKQLIADLGLAFESLTLAKTPEAKDAAAKNIAGIIARLPK